MLSLRKPYLLFLGDVTLKSDAKTGFGLRDWCPADVIGQWALPQATVSLGLPVIAPAEAAARGAGSLLIGVAPVGVGVRVGVRVGVTPVGVGPAPPPQIG